MKTFLFTALLAASAAPALAQPAPAAPQGPAAGFSRGNLARSVTRADVQVRVQRLFARLDANRDGFVTREELQAGRGQGLRGRGFRADGPRAEGLARNPAACGERLFARLDQNRDGVITRGEFDAAMAARAQHRAAAGQAGTDGGFRGGARLGRAGMGGFRGQMFERMDLNHDGRVSVQEATAFALQAFDRADANRDGVVTPEERRAARAGLGRRRL